MVYRWVDGARRGGSAQEVGERIDALRRKNKGVVTPQIVVRDAVAAKSPLHRYFAWDDKRAANEYRLDQARKLIADVAVVFAEEVDGAPTEAMRAFASIGAPSAPAYVSTLHAVQTPQLRAVVLANAKKELEVWQRRYRHYQELAAAVQKVGEIAENIAA